MTLDIDQLQDLVVFDRKDAKIGPIRHVYLDETGKPAFAAVKTGLLRSKSTIVALKHARRVSKGLRVPYDKPYVEDAPKTDTQGSGNLTHTEQLDINHYYGIARGDPGVGHGRSHFEGEERLRGAVGVGTAGYGEARQAAEDAAALRPDSRHVQAPGRDDLARTGLREDQRVYDDEYIATDPLVRLGLIDESRGRARLPSHALSET